MDRKDKINEEIEKTLNAHDSIGDLEPNPYLFTRLQAEIEKEAPAKRKIFSGGLLKPAALFLFVLLNVITSLYLIDSNSQSSGYTTYRQNYISAISSEYSLNQNYNTQLNKLMGE